MDSVPTMTTQGSVERSELSKRELGAGGAAEDPPGVAEAEEDQDLLLVEVKTMDSGNLCLGFLEPSRLLLRRLMKVGVVREVEEAEKIEAEVGNLKILSLMECQEVQVKNREVVLKDWEKKLGWVELRGETLVRVEVLLRTVSENSSPTLIICLCIVILFSCFVLIF